MVVKRCQVCCLHTFPEDFFAEYCDESDDREFEDLTECPFDLDSVPFADIDDLISFVDLHRDGVRAKDEDLVIHWIQ